MRIEKIDYTWDSYGHASEIIVLHKDIKYEQSEISRLREFAEYVKQYKEENSCQEFVSSQYDCTGQAFGSRFEKIDFRETEYGFVCTLVHSWSIDI